ncbi:uncharacterized protein LOC125235090 isoform X3 [Leguminivora glycinivorella]|uniref:uncharacterized protein LOC125235090 isoform X3 n=1 Tax=Leguminivora glycinivorella TaxID=1035111 RepID=UPI00200E36B4|nr:uncharacterized protein LOC125235090 isoform X3 [Leguminivora glycinivorella]
MRRQVERERELARQQADRERQQAELEFELARQQAVLARKQAEAEAQRERELAGLESEAEQMELQARLAALEASDKSVNSRSSYFSDHNAERRTTTWVSEQNANMTVASHENIPGEAPIVTSSDAPGLLLQPAAAANSVSFKVPTVNQATFSKPTQALLKNNYGTVAPRPPVQSEHCTIDPITKLSQAINALSNRPKKPELVTFSGDVGQWMAFKSSYERSKINFSPSENLDRLNVAVRGQAYQSVASLMWTCGSPDDVVQALEQTYARPELLVAREIADLRNTQKLSSAQDLNTLANKLRNFVTTLTILKQTEYLSSPELFRCILVKMSEHTRSRFTDYATAHTPEQQSITKLELLSRFLLIEADKQLKFNFVADSTVKAPTPPAYSNVSRNNAPKFPLKKETIHTTVSNETTSEHCAYCKQGFHKIKTCKSFLKLIVEDRWRWVRETKICYRCLKSNPHTWNNCRAKRCGVDGCPRRHNALLHGTGTTETNSGTAPRDQGNNLQTSSENSIRPVIINNTDNDITSAKIANTIDCSINATGSSPSTSLPQRPRGLLKVVPIVLEGPDGAFETTALLDDGSISTLIDADVAARIGAKPTSPERLRIEGVSNMSTELDVHAADIIEAEKMLVRQAQRESFPEELTNLRSSKPVPKDSRIKKLAPILDEEGLMRQDTRIISAPGVNNETKSPMILDGRHYISRLIIFHEHMHQKRLHHFISFWAPLRSYHGPRR